MQTQVQRLRDVLELLKPVVPTKTSMPVLTNVLLKDGYVTASDLENRVDVAFPEAQEALLLPYRDVVTLLKTIPGNTKLNILSVREGREAKVSLLAGEVMASFKVPLEEDYPPEPGETKLQGEFKISGDKLIKDMEELSRFAAREDSRPVLHAVALFFGDEPTMVAGDGFRLGERSLGGSLKLDGVESVLVPLAAVPLLSYLWHKGRKTPEVSDSASLTEVITGQRLIALGIAAHKLYFSFGDIRVMTARVEGSFPNYRQLIPADPPLKVTVDTERLGRALKSMSRISRSSSDIVRLEWKEDVLTVRARAEDSGEVRVDLPVKVQGGHGRIAFDIGKLMDYLVGRDGVVTIAATTPSSPAVLTDGGATKVVLMPMFVDWDGKPPVEKAEEKPEGTPHEPEASVEQEEPPAEVQETPPAAKAKPKKKRRKAA